jgi:hypothetical protein
MNRLSIVACVAISWVACKSKSEPGAGSAQVGSAPAGSAAAKPSAPPPKVLCDKAIPAAVKDKYLAKAQTDWGEPFESPDGGFVTSCRFQETEPDRRTIVQYRCGDAFADLEAYLKLIESQVAVKYERISGIGRGAYKSSNTFGVLHRSMPCIIEVEAMRGEPPIDGKALATNLEAALTP